MTTLAQQEALYAYLKSVKNTPYTLGEHDCLVLTNTATEILFGTGWASDVVGNYTNAIGELLSVSSLQNKFGSTTYKGFVDSRLTPYSGTPEFGMIAGVTKDNVFGIALGICVGMYVVFVDDYGLETLPVQEVDFCWVV